MLASTRNTTRLASTLLVLTALLAQSTPARAEPYMALRGGYSCADCHVNRTGGGMRTLTAEMHAVDILNLPNDGQGLLPAHDDWFSPNINDYFSVGADLRMVDRLLFQDDPDLNGEVENNTAFRDLESNDIDIEQATLYAELRLVPGVLSAYIDERVAPGGADNREAFLLADGIMPGDGYLKDAYLKAGKFFPAWGLKLQDDTAFVNSTSGFNFDRSVTGVELGRGGEGLNWAVSVSEGNEDNDSDQLLTANAFYLWTDLEGPVANAMLGGSASHDSPGNLEANTFALYTGLSRGALALLAQANITDTEQDNGSGIEDVQAWAGYVEANYLLCDWMNAKLAFDFYDPSDNIAEDTRNRVSVGVEPFIDRFLQLRAFYRVYNGPEDQPQHNRDELTLEMHLFF
ncbi:MAG: hypothetical protein H8E45_02310 [Proteobacteria bacterium]|nr:hypothetical protein [Pseudomonadota bacterium]